MRIFFQTKTKISLLFIAGIIALLSFSGSAMAGIFDTYTTDTSVIYCQPGDNCSLEKGSAIVKNNINNIEKEKKFSVFIQDIVSYLLAFLGIVGVLYLIYAGVKILTSGGNDDAVKKSKTIIGHVLIGLVLIFLAYSIVRFVIGSNGQWGIFNGSAFQLPSFIEETYAYTEYDINTFDSYKKQIELLSSTLDREYQVNNKISTKTLTTLEGLVRSSMDTFSDGDDMIYNTSLANNLLTAIELVKKQPDSDSSISGLAKGITDYLTKTKVARIKGTISASPATGNAPLVTTLKASEVTDPSGVTIPKANYIWWMRSAGGTRTILGTGPSLAYTFQEERTYTVFLNVLSASRNAKGKVDVLPFDSSVNVNVLPKIGNLYLSINGRYVSNEDKVKFTPTISRQGLLIDASASTPASGTKFVSTSIDYGNGNVVRYAGPPSLDRQIYANEGTYKFRMEVMTNENKQIIKELQIEIRNPIASIKAEKTVGFPGDEFRFGTSTPSSNELGYGWQITNLDDSTTLYTSNLQNISYKFKRTGKYAVRLRTLAANGKEDIDTVNVTIEGRDPIASFDSKASNSETPNTLLFDATTSYDPDNLDSTSLQYVWTIDGIKTNLDSPSRNGAIGKYTFDTTGTHKVSLEVTSKEDKTTTVTKDVIINSLLSVKLIIAPKIIRVGNTVSIIADSKEAQAFEWQFWDGESDTTTSGRITHLYKKSGTYNVSLTVRGRGQDDSNTISRRIYVTDSASPFSIITMKRENEEILPTLAVCDDKEAFVTDRSKPVSFSAADSVNTDGSNAGLTYTWKYANKSSSQKEFSYKFDELGCFPVSLTVRSEKTGAQHTSQTYVRIDNLPPKLSSLTISTDNSEADPVTVTVTANNAVDEDGAIASYIWYYYTAEDPEPQDFRITRSPKTVFVLPRIGAKYYFAVILEDSNGQKINSEDLTTERYSLTLVSDNINTPIIGLKASATELSVGQKVDFTVTAKNILGTDISSKAEYKWDYNGDGFYEETTNTPTVSYAYTAPGNFNFKVKVTYKGVSNTKYLAITVKNNLEPNLEYIAIGKKFIFLNTTKGLYTSVKWKIGETTSTNPDSFIYDFGAQDVSGDIVLEVSDGTNTKRTSATLRKDIANAQKIKKWGEKVRYFSYPSADDHTIHVKNFGDKVYIYLGASEGNISKYAIDTDISVDSDLNGEKADDIDNKGTESVANGSVYVLKTNDITTRERTMRLTLLDANNAVIGSQDVKIVLDFMSASTESMSGSVDMPKDISDADRINLEKLKDLIRSSPEQDRLKMMQYFSVLQENWFDTREKTKTIIDFEGYLDTSAMDQKTKEDFYSLLEGFLLSDTQVKDDIGLATTVLKSLIPKTNTSYSEIMKDIDEIVSHPTNTTLNKELGTFILNAIKDDATIDAKDKNIIKSQLQTIIYGGQANIPAANAVPATGGSSSGILGFLLSFGKIFLYILGAILALVFLAFVAFKIGNRDGNQGFQDFIIDKLTGKKAKTPTPPVREEPKEDIPGTIVTPGETVAQAPLPAVPEASTEIVQKEDAGIPDWLKASSFPVTPEEIPVSEVTPPEEPTPDATREEVPAEPENTVDSGGLPAWLKGSPTPSVEVPETKEEAREESPSLPEADNTLPAWMTGMDQEALKQEVREETENVLPVVPEETKEVSPYEDIPDWLKASTAPVVASSQEVAESPAAKPEEKPEAKDKAKTEPKDREVPKKGDDKKAKEPSVESVPKKKKPTPLVSETPKLPDSDENLPDWLK